MKPQQMESGWIVAIVAVLGLVAQLIAGLWRLANLKTEVFDAVARLREELQVGFSGLRSEREKRVREAENHVRDMEEKLETRCREIEDLTIRETKIHGDAMGALRQKISDVELEAIKIFVRRDSFMEIIERMSSEIKAHRAEMIAAFNANRAEFAARSDRLEIKLDKILEEGRPGPLQR
jgi:hypothetical protein